MKKIKTLKISLLIFSIINYVMALTWAIITAEAIFSPNLSHTETLAFEICEASIILLVLLFNATLFLLSYIYCRKNEKLKNIRKDV